MSGLQDMRAVPDHMLGTLTGAQVIECIDEGVALDYAGTGVVLDRWAAARAAHLARPVMRTAQKVRDALAGRREQQQPETLST